MSQTNCECAVPSVAIPVTGLTLNLSQEALGGAVAPGGDGAADALVRFDSNGNIVKSYGVESVKKSTGASVGYKITLTNAAPDTNYNAVFGVTSSTNSLRGCIVCAGNAAGFGFDSLDKTTTSFVFMFENHNGRTTAPDLADVRIYY